MAAVDASRAHGCRRRGRSTRRVPRLIARTRRVESVDALAMGHDWGVAVVMHTVRRRMPPRQAWSPAFNRFAVASAMSGAADAIVAVSLAGSLFFSLSPEASRQQVLLYLVINMAPFALLAPLVGPADRPLPPRAPLDLGDPVRPARRVCCRPGVHAARPGPVLLRPRPARRGQGVRRHQAGAHPRARRRARAARRGELPPRPAQRHRRRARRWRRRRHARRHRVPSGDARPGVRHVHRRPRCCRCSCPSITPREVLTPSVEYEELHAPTIVATSWAFTAIRAAVGFFVFGLAFSLRRPSEPTWMYGAAIAAYGAGTYLGNVDRAAAAAALRRGPADRRCARRAGDRAGVRRPRPVAGPRAAGVARARRRGVRRPPGLRRDGADARPDGDAWPLVRPLRDAVPARLGGRRGGRHRDRHPDPLQPGGARRAAAAVGVVVRHGAAHRAEAHAEDPFDPLEVARRRIDHAVEWHRRDLDRLAVTELAGVVDLARATGVDLTSSAVVRLDALRAAALSTWPLDSREVEWAMTYASSLVGRLDRRRPARWPCRDVDRNGRRTSRRRVGAAGPIRTRRRRDRRDVTAQCDERRAIVRTTSRSPDPSGRPRRR